MTDNVVRADFAAKQVQTNEYFGGCPRCGEADGYVNLGLEQWFFCGAHSVRWFVGTGLFSTCEEARSQAELAKEYKVRSYAVVEPVRVPLAEDASEDDVVPE